MSTSSRGLLFRSMRRDGIGPRTLVRRHLLSLRRPLGPEMLLLLLLRSREFQPQPEPELQLRLYLRPRQHPTFWTLVLLRVLLLLLLLPRQLPRRRNLLLLISGPLKARLPPQLQPQPRLQPQRRPHPASLPTLMLLEAAIHLLLPVVLPPPLGRLRLLRWGLRHSLVLASLPMVRRQRLLQLPPPNNQR